jgi:hypothetical protein
MKKKVKFSHGDNELDMIERFIGVINECPRNAKMCEDTPEDAPYIEVEYEVDEK